MIVRLSSPNSLIYLSVANISFSDGGKVIHVKRHDGEVTILDAFKLEGGSRVKIEMFTDTMQPMHSLTIVGEAVGVVN